MVGLIDYSKRKADTTTTRTSSSAAGTSGLSVSNDPNTKNGNAGDDNGMNLKYQHRIPQQQRQRRPTGAFVSSSMNKRIHMGLVGAPTKKTDQEKDAIVQAVQEGKQQDDKSKKDPSPSSYDHLFSTAGVGGESSQISTQSSCSPFQLRRGGGGDCGDNNDNTLAMNNVNNLQYRHQVPQRRQTAAVINKRIQIGQLRASLEKTDREEEEEEEKDNKIVQAAVAVQGESHSTAEEGGSTLISNSTSSTLPSPFHLTRGGAGTTKEKSIRLTGGKTFFQRCGTSELVKEHRNRRPTTLQEMSHRNLMMTMKMMSTSDRAMSSKSIGSQQMMTTQEEEGEGEEAEAEAEDSRKNNNLSKYLNKKEKQLLDSVQLLLPPPPPRRPSQIDWSQPSRRTVPQTTPATKGGIGNLLSLRRSISVRSINSAGDEDNHKLLSSSQPKLKTSVSMTDLRRQSRSSTNNNKARTKNNNNRMDSSNNSCCSFTLRRRHHHRRRATATTGGDGGGDGGDDDNSISSVNRLEQSLFQNDNSNNDILANKNKMITAPLSPLGTSKRISGGNVVGGSGSFGMRRSTSSSSTFGMLMMMENHSQQYQPNRGRCLSPGNTTSRQQQDLRRSLSPCLLRAAAGGGGATPNLQIPNLSINDDIPMMIKLTPGVDLDNDDLLASTNHSSSNDQKMRTSTRGDWKKKTNIKTNNNKSSSTQQEEEEETDRQLPGFRRNLTDESIASFISASDDEDDVDEDDNHPDVPLKITLTSTSSGLKDNDDDDDDDDNNGPQMYHNNSNDKNDIAIARRPASRSCPRRSVSLATTRSERTTALLNEGKQNNNNKKYFPRNTTSRDLSASEPHHLPHYGRKTGLRRSTSNSSFRSASDPRSHGRRRTGQEQLLSSSSAHQPQQQRISLGTLLGGRYASDNNNNNGGDDDESDDRSCSSIMSNRSSFGNGGRSSNKASKRGKLRRASSFIAGSKIRRHDGTGSGKKGNFELLLG